MTGRPHGPLCVSKVGEHWIDTGTMARTRSSVPGPLRGDSARPTSRLSIPIPIDVPGKLLLGARAGLPHLGTDVREKVADALTIENMAIMAAGVALLFATAGTGVGLLIEIVLGGAAVIFVGADVLTGFAHLKSFYETASKATSEADFKKAGLEFSLGITTLGIDTAIVLLTRRAGRTLHGKVPAAATEAEIQAGWLAYVDSIKFQVEADKGIIWSKKLGEQAAQAALERDGSLRVLNSILDEVGFTKQYQKEFGSVGSLVTYRIWERVSTRYVSALRGKVTAYVDPKALDTAILKSNEHILAPLEGGKPGTPFLVAELERIAEIMELNGSIRSVELIDVRTGAVINRMDRMTLLKEAHRMGAANRPESH